MNNPFSVDKETELTCPESQLVRGGPGIQILAVRFS